MLTDQTKLLSANPFVAVVDNFFDASLAQEVIALAEGAFHRAKVVDGKGGHAEQDSRTNESAVIDQWSDNTMTRLVNAVAGLVRLPSQNAEPCQLLRYRGDQKFDVHPDAFDDSPGGRDCIAQGGQRLFTTICYLNDVPKGGETEFPHLKLRITPKLGRVLIFGNTVLGTADAHPHSLHGGRAVEEGEKYALSTWWRQRTYHNQHEFPAQVGDTRVI